MKRFWKDVTVQDNAVLLDGRPVRTPARAPLILPTPALAKAVADEWRSVGDSVDPRAMPLTGLANAAIDRPVAAEVLAPYAETDLLCYRADPGDALRARQDTIWDPPLDWARNRYDVAFNLTDGIVHVAQPAATVARLAAAIAGQDDHHRTALSPIITIGGSAVLALMLAEGAIEPDAAFDAAHLDELWQAELWGEDALAVAARDARRRDFTSAVRYLRLLD